MRRWASLAIALGSAAGCIHGVDEDDGGFGVTSMPPMVPTEAMACDDHDDCAEGAEGCWLVDCEVGVCVYEIDGFYDEDHGTPGDCTEYVCDGQGRPIPQPSQTDAPSDDNPCTEDRCAPDPVYTPLPTNSSCSGPLADAPAYCYPDATCHYCKYAPETCDPEGDGGTDDAQDGAVSLGTIDDADLFEQYFRCDELASAADIDWFTFQGTDDLLGLTDPQPRLYTGGVGGRVCMFFACAVGTTSVDCGDAEPATAPNGQDGCCAAASLAPGLSCGFLNGHAAQVWIRVDQGPAACTPYELKYNY